MKNQFGFVLLGIVVLACVLRLVALGNFPQRFNQDEMVLGYDSWSIWQTGRDQHGNSFPLQFRNFNDYVPPVANYITAPFVGLLGLDETTTRLPAALLGIVTVAGVGLLGRLWFGEIAGLSAALLLTFEPWHLNYSRIAFPASFVPFFITVALYGFTRGIRILASDDLNRQRRSLYWLLPSALSLSLVTATYSTMKVEAPIMLGACILSGIVVFRQNWKVALIWIAAFLVFVSPFVIDQILHWDLAQSRFQGISVFSLPDWPLRLVLNYGAHYDPSAWFYNGLRGGIAVHPPRVGELFWLELPLGLLAIFVLLRRRSWQTKPFLMPVLLGIWFVTFPVAASLTRGGITHEIRSYNLLPLPEFLAGYGIAVIWDYGAANRQRRRLVYGVLTSIVVVFLIFNAYFLRYFFSASLQTEGQPKPYDNLGLRPALEQLQSLAQPCDVIWMDQTSQQTYIYYLFMTRMPPVEFQNASVVKNSDLYLRINEFNNVHFGSPNSNMITIPGCKNPTDQVFYVHHNIDATIPDGWEDITTWQNNEGQPFWQVLIKRT